MMHMQSDASVFLPQYPLLAAITTHQKRDTQPQDISKQTKLATAQNHNQTTVHQAQTQRNNNSPTKPKLLNKQTKQ